MTKEDDRCIQEVWTNERFPRRHRCYRKGGHGPDGKYCFQHNPEAVAERERKRQEKWEKETEAWQRAHTAKNIGFILMKVGVDTEVKAKKLARKIDEKKARDTQ